MTGTAQKKAWDENILPPVEMVGDGLWSIPVPIPDNPLRYVLVYVLEAGEKLAIVDAGWDTIEAWDALKAGLEVMGAKVEDISAVLVTHIHPDHYGLAGRVREASGAWIGLHPADAAMLKGRYVDTSELLSRMEKLLERSGVPNERLPDLEMASMVIRSLVTMAEPDILFEDHSPVDLTGWDLITVWTPGHSPGHVCFFSEKRQLLLTGDHVLPRITPNVAVHSQQDSNPLGDYLQSLLKVRNIAAYEVLPAHEYRFSGLADRVDEIIAHHQRRLDEIVEAVRQRPGSTAWEITIGLHWSRPWEEIPDFMQRAANGETLAHLVVLELKDQVHKVGDSPWRYYPGPGL
ncbi:MAG: MBL fold metallo-hydrolase [Actinobacteria bacterium]|nr:MBL fold metallo-hydrolase [Actinomycetota bacterium]